MQFEGTRRSSGAPNLTPLIDIVFLLLVFFMLTAHFVNDEGLPIELPEAVSAVMLDEKRPLEIRIDRSGQMKVDGNFVAISDLANYLMPEIAERSDKRVVIRGDQGVTLGDSVQVIDAARRAGATGVDIVTEKPAG